jgi:glycosyltransferase involved in cell wall biosynthesis
MTNTYSESISDFLQETEPYMEQLDGLSFGVAAELYDLLEDAANVSTLHIDIIDPELRVELCDRLDKVLERIIDVLPPFEHTGNQLKIYSPSLGVYKNWYNIQLMKDCGLAGYLLAKEIGGKPVMLFGTAGDDYSYLSILPGLELIYRDGDDPDDFLAHMETNYAEMDVLMLYGMYAQSLGYLDAYRVARPDGRVYCGLDMNTHWMKNIDWDEAPIKQFAQQCDIIATSCRTMRDMLNRFTKFHFPCRWLPNGFYNPTGLKITATPEYKKNTILMVGRVGDGQKNNEELMIAFAGVSNLLTDWSLRFVGPIDPRIQPFMDWYFSQHPQLKERVIFTGPITDKAKLYDEYAKAKVFALSSRTESGTPNVYAEALFHGCMFVTSDIDAADDITKYGELGAVYTRGDSKGLAEALVKVCSNADEQAFKVHIPKALDYAAKCYDWNRNVKKLAYMLFN